MKLNSKKRVFEVLETRAMLTGVKFSFNDGLNDGSLDGIASAYSAADLDGDLDLDVVAQAANSVLVYENKGEEFQLRATYEIGATSGVRLGDVDGDLDNDLVVGSFTDDSVWIQNIGDWEFEDPSPLKIPRRFTSAVAGFRSRWPTRPIIRTLQ